MVGGWEDGRVLHVPIDFMEQETHHFKQFNVVFSSVLLFDVLFHQISCRKATKDTM